MAETETRQESTEARTSPEVVTSNAVASLEASDPNYSKWIAGAAWEAGSTTTSALLVVGYGATRLALKAIEFAANIGEHLAKNMTNIEDPKFYMGLFEAGAKPFKRSDKDKK